MGNGMAEELQRPDDTPERQLEAIHNAKVARYAAKPPIRFDAPNSKFLPEVRERFLQVYAKFGVIQTALDAVGISRNCHLDHIERNPEYAEAFDLAKKAFADDLEAHVLAGARGEWTEPVYFKGKVVGYRNVRSEKMLELSIKAKKAEEYREKASQTNVMSGGVIYMPGHAENMEEWAKEQGAEIVKEEEIEDGFGNSSPNPD